MQDGEVLVFGGVSQSSDWTAKPAVRRAKSKGDSMSCLAPGWAVCHLSLKFSVHTPTLVSYMSGLL